MSYLESGESWQLEEHLALLRLTKILSDPCDQGKVNVKMITYAHIDVCAYVNFLLWKPLFSRHCPNELVIAQCLVTLLSQGIEFFTDLKNS